MKKRVEIVFFITGLNFGGAEMMLYRKLKNLNKLRYYPYVISILPLGPVAKMIQRELNVSVYSLNMKNKANISVVFKLYVLLKKIKPDILHTYLSHANILGRVIGKLAGVPIILSSIRNTYFGSKYREKLIRWTDKWTLKTTTICHAAGDRMKAEGIVPPDKLQVIHNGIDFESFDINISWNQKKEIRKELSLPGESFLLLAVGRLHKQKGYPYLINALKEVKNYGVSFTLLIAGEGEMRPQLEQQVMELGLEDNVHFLGLRNDVPKLMSAVDMLVLSSIWEGLPGVVLEAMASGLPVVSTAVGGAPELVYADKTGYLVPPKDSDALASAIIKLMNLSEEERIAMGRAGRSHVEENFTLDKMVSSYEKLYEECLIEKCMR